MARRFRCRAMHCPAKIFAERFPPVVTRPYARRTSRLQGLVRHLDLALGGRPAQALAGRLVLPVSKDIFLRSVRDTSEAVTSELRVIGIDDGAWRKGQRYGTLICDLERCRVIDLLPDREPATVEAWLRTRPGIEIVARDRNGGYGGTVSRALPRAVQVADRWHLLENASAAFLAAVQRTMPASHSAPCSRRIGHVLGPWERRTECAASAVHSTRNIACLFRSRQARITQYTGFQEQFIETDPRLISNLPRSVARSNGGPAPPLTAPA